MKNSKHPLFKERARVGSRIFITILSLLIMLVAIPMTQAQAETKLVFWSMWNQPEPQAKVLQGYINEFQKKHPNIKISVVWNGRQNQTLVRTALKSGTQIDFMDGHADSLAGGIIKEGQAYQLNQLLDQPALDEKVAFKSIFSPGLIEQFSQHGKFYLVPYIYNTIQFWYNKKIFKKAGVKPPKTWKEFMEINDKILKAGYIPIAMEGDIAGYHSFYMTYLVARAMGPDFLLRSIEDKTGKLWLDPAHLEAAKRVRELWDRKHIPAKSVGYLWPAGQQTLAFEESAMELVGSWLPIELAKITAKDFEWGAFRFPTVPGGKGSIDDLQATILSFLILKKSKHPKDAFEFLRFVMTQKNQQKMADQALVGVTHSKVKWQKAVADGSIAAASAKSVYGDFGNGAALYAEFTSNILKANNRLLMVGEITPEQYVKRLSTQAAAFWKNR